jgi:hypothetical protein
MLARTVSFCMKPSRRHESLRRNLEDRKMLVNCAIGNGYLRLGVAAIAAIGLWWAKPATAQTPGATTAPAVADSRPSPKFSFTAAAVPGFTQVKATDA